MEFMKTKIQRVQDQLLNQKLDGWLLYDFKKQNDLACKFLDIPEDLMLTRRLFYWIPAKGEPIALVHAVEKIPLEGIVRTYTTWAHLIELLRQMLDPSMHIAMEISPIPYLSKVDGYTYDLVRSLVNKVATSAELLQQFTSVLTPEQMQSHFKAADIVQQIVSEAWTEIEKRLGKISEWDVQNLIIEKFKQNQCVANDSPICAVNGNSANPHYFATEKGSSLIKNGDYILIDLWTKLNAPNCCYADITQVGVAGEPTKHQQNIFQIVKNARDAAIEYIQTACKKGVQVRGCDVDFVARNVIEKEGYGKFFIHRLGHNIYTSDHGPGANLDGFETEDTRFLLPNTCFSIEPGIYLPDQFGIRLECDMVIHENGRAEPTGGLQEKLIALNG